VIILEEKWAMTILKRPGPYPLWAAPLGKRINFATLVKGHPSKQELHRFRTECGAVTHRQGIADDGDGLTKEERAFLYVPPARLEQSGGRKRRRRGGFVQRDDIDPIKLINAIDFCRHLRSTAEFGETLMAARRYEADPDVDVVERDASQDPARSSLQRARARADIVGMNIERRQFHAEMASDMVESIQCYSDSSPVTGHEIQGMMCDVRRRDNTMRTVILPGGTLNYGMFDAVNKTMAFLWAVWLCFGPLPVHLAYFCSKVTCFTTDFGIEMLSVEMVDVREAFLAWIAGRSLEDVRGLIRWGRRLFPRSLRIAGWSHACGNIMKKLAKSCVAWPEHLSGIRSLLQFLRIHTYREFIAHALTGRLDGIVQLMDQQFPTMAKWRYETIVVVEGSLLKVRRRCQEFLDEAMFANVKDRMLLHSAMAAAKNRGLWIFIAVTHAWIMWPIEQIRHWGMVRPCCHDKRAQGIKHVRCPNNSRRIHQVPEFTEKKKAEFKEWSKT